MKAKSKSALPIGMLLALSMTVGTVAVVYAQGADSNYMGVEKCKNCHEAAAKGNQYAKWQQMKHSKAYDNLGTDQAKELGKKAGVDDPQKSDKCLKCHVTAFTEPAGRKDEKFDNTKGVQCESCHGPGGFHVKSRLAEASQDSGDVFDTKEQPYKELPAGEIIGQPDEATCKKCHNPESPTYKEFNFNEVIKSAEFQHPDPRKKK